MNLFYPTWMRETFEGLNCWGHITEEQSGITRAKGGSQQPNRVKPS
jgi:hypothetical protein